jgi:hypothetical protein
MRTEAFNNDRKNAGDGQLPYLPATGYGCGNQATRYMRLTPKVTALASQKLLVTARF